MEGSFEAKAPNEKNDFIVRHWPDSEMARILTESVSVNSLITAVSGTMHTPSVSSWQRVLSGARLISSGGGGGGEPGAYYADWYAPPQTRSGSFDFEYNINSDKYQRDTLEKVDEAVIDIEPLEKGGTIDGVKAVAGYTHDKDGRIIAFAFMANNLASKDEALFRIHEDIIKRLLSLPEGN